MIITIAELRALECGSDEHKSFLNDKESLRPRVQKLQKLLHVGPSELSFSEGVMSTETCICFALAPF